MRMLNLPQLEKMVVEFLESERPEMFSRLTQSGELEALAKSRASAAMESYRDQMDLSTEETRAMNKAEKESPALGQPQYLAMRESRIVESVLTQMLELPSEATEDETM